MFIVRGSHTLVLQCDYKTHFFEYYFFFTSNVYTYIIIHISCVQRMCVVQRNSLLTAAAENNAMANDFPGGAKNPSATTTVGYDETVRI